MLFCTHVQNVEGREPQTTQAASGTVLMKIFTLITSFACSINVSPATPACLLLQGLEGREPVALVVDDTSSVWGNHEENLVAVERYIYFPASRRQFGSKAKSLLEMRRDETPQSGMLMTALSVLLRTHARMFRVLSQSCGVEAAGHRLGERPPWDVRQVLQDERKQVTISVQAQCHRVV